MTEIDSLRQDIKNLPDELIKRLDDRYVKKDDFAKYDEKLTKKYVTWFAGKIAMGTLTLIITILGVFDYFLTLNRGK